MPEKYPEYGQCVHELLRAPGNSGVLFQRNHCGVYRSADFGNSWQEITKGLLSDFGFPLTIHPREPETIYVVPLQGAEFRCPPESRLRMFRSRDGGKNWQALATGLPQQEIFCGCYRESMANDTLAPAGIYLGTNTGKLFATRDEGDAWFVLADNLPPINSVEAEVV